MSLRARLYIAGALSMLLLLVPAFYGLARLFELRAIAFDLKTRHSAAYLAVGQLRSSLAELNRMQRSYVALPGPGSRDAVHEELRRAEDHLRRLAQTGYQDVVQGQAAILDSLQRATLRIDALIQRGAVGEATVDFDLVKPLFNRAQDTLAAIAEVIDARSGAVAARAQAISNTAAQTTSLAFGVALALALLVGVFAVAALTSPLRRLRSAMASVAAGDLVAPRDLPYGRRDELGDLCRSFRSMAQRLAELDRLKAEFVGIASHELKTPVSVIEGYAEMMEDGLYGPVTERQAEMLRYLREQTRALTERVNQLLSVSRLEARGVQLSVRNEPLRPILEDVSRAFASLASQKGIGFSVEVHPSAPERVELDADRVRHELLGNVVANAFKFTPSGGCVEVRAWGRWKEVVFEVRDTGEGIPPSEIPYIFEKYYQAGYQAGKVGTGLGLAIAREVAEAHGGTIEAHSEPGKGTVVQVHLPLQHRRPAAAGRGDATHQRGAARETAAAGARGEELAD